MYADILLGGQWGDEGKAKIVDVLAERYDVVVRYQGGANAGHTVKLADQTFVFHQIPSGILSQKTTSVLANGMVIDLEKLCEEIELIASRGIEIGRRLQISERAFLVLPYHHLLDEAQERQLGSRKIGTTKRGIGPAYMDKIGRSGFRVGDLRDTKAFKAKLKETLAQRKELFESYYHSDFPYQLDPMVSQLTDHFKKIEPYVTDTTYFLSDALAAGKKVLLEGAQGAGLDIDFGTYPYVTSSSTTSGGAMCGSGIPPKLINRVFGIFKAYVTRVGAGAMPTVLGAEELTRLQTRGGEFGATTGRPRDCGWFDGVQARFSVMINGMTDIALTKLDVLSGYETIKVATHYEIAGNKTERFPYHEQTLTQAKPVYKEFLGWEESAITQASTYEDFPQTARDFIEFLEVFLKCPIRLISTGPERTALIERLPKD